MSRDRLSAMGWPAAAPPSTYDASEDLYRRGFLAATSMLVTKLRDRINTPARRELFEHLDAVRAWAEGGAEDAKPPRLWGETAP